MNSEVVDIIIDNLMQQTIKDEARSFLTFIDNYVCYYINRKNDDGICFPIIRISSCPEWARKILLKYMILRLSICYNDDTISHLKPKEHLELSYIDPEDKDKARQARQLNQYASRLNNYKRKIKDTLVNPKYIGETKHKNLIFCTEQDLMDTHTNKNKFINEFYDDENELTGKKNLCVCHNITSRDIKEQLKKSNEQILIDNIFILYTNNEPCKSLERTSLERINKSYNVGIRNCFVFDISKKPFRINRSYHRGILFGSIYPMIPEKDFKCYEHYTVLNDEESRYLFNVKDNSSHQFIDIEDNIRKDFFEDSMGSLLEDVDCKIQERNNFSLCINDAISSIYQKHLKDLFHDYSEDDYNASFYYQHNYGQKILEEIADCMDHRDETDLAIVIGRDVPKSVKQLIRDNIPNYGVHIYDYNSLKPKKNKQGFYINSIKQKNVFVLQYRPHYATTGYSKYPNSFDPYCVNTNQRIVEFIQGFSFKDMYLWDKYEYELIQYKYFNSEYRRIVLGGINKPEKPTIKRITGETDFGDDNVQNHGVAQSERINFVDGTHIHVYDTEWVLYTIDDNKDFDVAQLRDIKAENHFQRLSSLQKLDDIIEPLSILIEQKEHKDSEYELYLRCKAFDDGLITEKEKESPTALWKILLAHKVNMLSVNDVYHEIMKDLKDSQCVRINSFIRWYDKDNPMILPLQKVCQHRLFEYLGFSSSSPYLRIMRAKKISVVNGTRKKNNMMQEFMADLLLSDSDEEIIDKYRDSEINDFLQLSSAEDISSLRGLLELDKYINLKPIIKK
jgi:hypothetical protein